MATYIISNDYYLQEGIVLLAKEARIEVVRKTIDTLPFEQLSFADCVILHLNLNNKCCAKEISRLNQKCKLLVIQSLQKNALRCDADAIIKAREPLSDIILTLSRLDRMNKNQVRRHHLLNCIEKIIICESLEGKDIHFIAKSLSLPPKRVYTWRNIACKKLGGTKIHDLLLIKDNLADEAA